jgi:hypothetical protein
MIMTKSVYVDGIATFLLISALSHIHAVPDGAMDEQAQLGALHWRMPSVAFHPVPLVARLVLLDSFRSVSGVWGLATPLSTTFNPRAGA